MYYVGMYVCMHASMYSTSDMYHYQQKTTTDVLHGHDLRVKVVICSGQDFDSCLRWYYRKC